MSKLKIKETDLFPPMKLWLEERDYEVFSEVESSYTGGRADIVATCGPSVTVVELKTSFSLELIEQAVRWKPYANYVFVGIPRRSRHHDYGELLLQREGIGILEVDFTKKPYLYPNCHLKPKYHRRINDHLRSSLLPEHKLLPGGHAGGGFVTTYSITMENVKNHLLSWYIVHEKDGWASITDILEHVDTHYHAPRPSLTKALLSFEQDWCETKKEKGRWYFRHKDGKKNWNRT